MNQNASRLAGRRYGSREEIELDEVFEMGCVDLHLVDEGFADGDVDVTRRTPATSSASKWWAPRR